MKSAFWGLAILWSWASLAQTAGSSLSPSFKVVKMGEAEVVEAARGQDLHKITPPDGDVPRELFNYYLNNSSEYVSHRISDFWLSHAPEYQKRLEEAVRDYTQLSKNARVAIGMNLSMAFRYSHRSGWGTAAWNTGSVSLAGALRSSIVSDVYEMVRLLNDPALKQHANDFTTVALQNAGGSSDTLFPELKAILDAGCQPPIAMALGPDQVMDAVEQTQKILLEHVGSSIPSIPSAEADSLKTLESSATKSIPNLVSFAKSVEAMVNKLIEKEPEEQRKQADAKLAGIRAKLEMFKLVAPLEIEAAVEGYRRRQTSTICRGV